MTHKFIIWFIIGFVIGGFIAIREHEDRKDSNTKYEWIVVDRNYEFNSDTVLNLDSARYKYFRVKFIPVNNDSVVSISVNCYIDTVKTK